jgi:hypothetical protein
MQLANVIRNCRSISHRGDREDLFFGATCKRREHNMPEHDRHYCRNSVVDPSVAITTKLLASASECSIMGTDSTWVSG